MDSWHRPSLSSCAGRNPESQTPDRKNFKDAFSREGGVTANEGK
jgi:hypothetical protein